MSKVKYKILLAEDDLNLGRLLCDYLKGEGMEVILCKDGEEALTAYQNFSFDLCLLDVMMPKMDGFTLAKHIRANNKNIPLMFITARSFKQDKLIGYDIGADDYITKPFDEEELMWKMKALIRRIRGEKEDTLPSLITIGKYKFNPLEQSLTIDDRLRRITKKESRILKYMVDHKNKLIHREDMLKEIWGENDYFLGRSLDVFITKIRKYLGDDETLSIENVFAVGFIFHVPE